MLISCPAVKGAGVRRRLRSIGGTCLIAAACSAIVACKVVVIVPPGGKVVTEDGFECLAGQTCIIDVRDTAFDSTFTAVPDPGNTFSRWRARDRYFCGNTAKPCHLATTGFTGHDNLMAVLAGDDEFYLQPQFVDFDVSYWKQTLAQIDRGNFATDNFLYATPPIVGQCDPGALKQGPKNRALEAVNQTRSLHNLPAVDYADAYDTAVQESSLVQRANHQLNHTPDPSAACYTQSARDAASTSNLSAGSSQSDPAADVFGWTNDNNNVASLMEGGHRRWMLFPKLGYISYGQVEGFATLKVFGFNMQPMRSVPADLDFVAVPYRYYPYVLMSQAPKPTPWSLSMVPTGTMSDAFGYFARAQVSVTETDSGRPMAVSDVHRDSKGFGLANFLSWMVEGWAYDVDYTVRVRDITVPGGGSRVLEYPVTVDRYDLLTLAQPREPGDSRTDNMLQGRFDNADDRDSFTMTLSGDMTVTGGSEFSNWAFFVLVYNADKQLVKASDQPFSLTLPFGNYTVVISHCDDNGLCYQGTQTYRVNFG